VKIFLPAMRVGGAVESRIFWGRFVQECLVGRFLPLQVWRQVGSGVRFGLCSSSCSLVGIEKVPEAFDTMMRTPNTLIYESSSTDIRHVL